MVVAKTIEGTILVMVDMVVVLVADEVAEAVEAAEIREETFPEIPTLCVLIVRFRVMLLFQIQGFSSGYELQRMVYVSIVYTSSPFSFAVVGIHCSYCTSFHS